MDGRVWKKSWISPREEPRAHSNFTVEQPLSLADLSWICVLSFIGNGSSCGIMRWPSLKFHCIGKIMWHTWVALPGNRIKTIIFPLQLGLYVWVKCPLFLKGGSLLCNLGYVSIRCHNDQIMGGFFLEIMTWSRTLKTGIIFTPQMFHSWQVSLLSLSPTVPPVKQIPGRLSLCNRSCTIWQALKGDVLFSFFVI